MHAPLLPLKQSLRTCIASRVFARAVPVRSQRLEPMMVLQEVPWQSLGTPERELTLSNTLPTGQSFRWYPTEDDTFTGVVGERVVRSSDLLFLLSSTRLQEYLSEVG